MRAYSVQVETLRRLRHGGDQYVRVEQVHIGDGWQAAASSLPAAGKKFGSWREVARRTFMAAAPR